MLEAEELLAARFKNLSDSRDGPVFFIEHSLSEVDTGHLRDTVSREATRFPLQDNWWRLNPLPLVVTATEVGYRYRGHGTDFWPKLESALGIQISLEARQRVRDLFARCSSKYRGARPPVTPWTQAFRLIAWPVTHALVPLEFHRHLSTALANLRSSVHQLDDDALHQAVQFAAAHPSARFEAFLHDRAHAIPVIRALLGEGNSEISQHAVDRINLDLTADRDARLDMTVARRRQERLRKCPTASGVTATREVLKGLFQLRFREGDRLAIEAEFHPEEGPDLERLRRILRRRRFRPRLWGMSSPVPSEWLLAGLPFPVNLRAVPDTGSALFQGLDELGLDSELRGILESFQLDIRLPMLFAANADGDRARLVRGSQVSATREYWLLAEKQEAGRFADMPQLGEVGPLVCFRLNPSQPRAALELDRLRYRVRHGLSISIIGSPPLDDGDAVPRYLVGDERIVVPKREHPPGTKVRLGPETILMDGSLVRVPVHDGEQFLEISTQGASRRVPFVGVREAGGQLRRSCWIELSTDERTVQALLGGSFALRVDGLAPLEGLTLTVELEAGGSRMGTSFPLDPLPQVLMADQEPWLTLLNEATRERILQDQQPVVLHARVGVLAAESWTLERGLRPCWWTLGPNGPVLNSELGPIDHGEISIARPAERPVPALPGGRDEAVILAPMEPNEAVFGPAAGFATYCTAPTRTALLTPRTEKPKLRRSRWSSAGSLGMEDLAEAWLRWSLAECDRLTAEIRRRQVAMQLDKWIAEICCGKVWARREGRLRFPSADPWKLLAEECLRRGRGLDDLIELSKRDQEEVIRLAVAEIQRNYADLWARIGPLAARSGVSCESFLDDEDYANFDAACASAYSQLADRYRHAGGSQVADLIDSADPGAGPDQWDPVFEYVIAETELRELGALLLPTDTAGWLMSLDLTLMPLDEVAEELQIWARQSRHALAGKLPSSELLRAILAFWIAPRAAVSLNWRGALETLVAERPLARSARYLALRARHVRPGSIPK